MPIYPANPTHVERAAQLLRDGEIVAFPTETVYGLGGNALSADAVAKIYAAKGRPSHNPLIVHVADAAAARTLVTHWPEAAEIAARHFWPGPLTLVLPRAGALADNLSAGLPTVAIRVPAHPVALELLRAAGVPVAAPSANRSNEVSPSRPEHVIQSMGENTFVLDGGPCEVGIESTVLDLTGLRPVILRPGRLLALDLEPVLGPLGEKVPSPEGDVPRSSPGQLERHYAPRAAVHFFTDPTNASPQGPLHARRVGVIARHPTRLGIQEVVLSQDPKEFARELYTALRQLDDAGCDLILIEQVPDLPAWDAIRDRLRRASTPA